MGTDERPQAIDLVGRYELQRKVGSGGTGVVFLAFDPLLEREVAIKVPRFRTLGSEKRAQIRADFYHKAAISGRFHHPNIVTVHDVGRDGDSDFIVMEYVDGESLSEYIKSAKVIALEETLRLMYECCVGLDNIHYYGVIHRDIKLGNIMLSAD